MAQKVKDLAFHCCGLDPCCGTGSIPGSGTSACHEHSQKIQQKFYFCHKRLTSFFFSFSFILGPHPWHMEVSKLGVKLEP